MNCTAELVKLKPMVHAWPFRRPDTHEHTTSLTTDETRSPIQTVVIQCISKISGVFQIHFLLCFVFLFGVIKYT